MLPQSKFPTTLKPWAHSAAEGTLTSSCSGIFLFTLVTGIWWTVLQPFVQQERARSGDAISEDFEWLVGVMAKMDRQAGAVVLIDAAYVANWLAVGAIESLEDNIRIEQSLRTVTITTSDRLDTAQSLGAAPTPERATAPGLTAESGQEH